MSQKWILTADFDRLNLEDCTELSVTDLSLPMLKAYGRCLTRYLYEGKTTYQLASFTIISTYQLLGVLN